MRWKATSTQKKIEHRDDMKRLNRKNDSLTQKNQLLREAIANFKSIIEYASSSTFLPPSSDQMRYIVMK